MGADDAAANDHPDGKSWCLPTFVGLFSGLTVGAWGLWVLTVDVVKLFA